MANIHNDAPKEFLRLFQGYMVPIFRELSFERTGRIFRRSLDENDFILLTMRVRPRTSYGDVAFYIDWSLTSSIMCEMLGGSPSAKPRIEWGLIASSVDAPPECRDLLSRPDYWCRSRKLSFDTFGEKMNATIEQYWQYLRLLRDRSKFFEASRVADSDYLQWYADVVPSWLLKLALYVDDGDIDDIQAEIDSEMVRRPSDKDLVWMNERFRRRLENQI